MLTPKYIFIITSIFLITGFKNGIVESKYLIEKGWVNYEVEVFRTVESKKGAIQQLSKSINILIQFWDYGKTELITIVDKDSLMSYYKKDTIQFKIREAGEFVYEKRKPTVYLEYFVKNPQSFLFQNVKYYKERETKYKGVDCKKYLDYVLILNNKQINGNVTFFNDIPLELIVNVDRKKILVFKAIDIKVW